jgi:hypothetical protein
MIAPRPRWMGLPFDEMTTIVPGGFGLSGDPESLIP